MNIEEYKILVEKMQKTKKEYTDYLDQFITSTIDGKIQNITKKIMTQSDFDKLKEIKSKADKAYTEWYNASIDNSNPVPLINPKLF